MSQSAKRDKQKILKKQKQQIKLERKQAHELRKAERLEQRLARREDRRNQRATVNYETQSDREKAVELLEQIVSGIRSGSVSVEHDGEKLELSPAEGLGLRVSARRTWKSESVAIRLRWSREQIADDNSELKISAGPADASAG